MVGVGAFSSPDRLTRGVRDAFNRTGDPDASVIMAPRRERERLRAATSRGLCVDI
jgi:hypothetical protein